MKRLMTMVLAGFAGVCSAATINVPADQATIAAAITAASAEDEIVLAVGTHYMDATLLVNKKLTIRGATGDRDDVIVQPNAGKNISPIFRISTAAGTVVRDLTIAKANTGYGQAAEINVAASVINCRITECRQDGSNCSGLICGANNVAVTVKDCLFDHNVSDTSGNGIGLYGSYRAGKISAMVYVQGNNSLIENCTVVSNSVVGWYVKSNVFGIRSLKGGTIRDCEIAYNTAQFIESYASEGPWLLQTDSTSDRCSGCSVHDNHYWGVPQDPEKFKTVSLKNTEDVVEEYNNGPLYPESEPAVPTQNVSDVAGLFSALESAEPWSEIVLATGAYTLTADLDIQKPVTIRSATGNRDDVTISGNANKYCVRLWTDGAVLKDVTVTASIGDTWYKMQAPIALFGGGKVENCRVTGNTINAGICGIRNYNGTVIDTLIDGNTSRDYYANFGTNGNGPYWQCGSLALMDRCVVSGNRAWEVYEGGNGNYLFSAGLFITGGTVRNTQVSGNRMEYNASKVTTSTTIAANRKALGIYMTAGSVENCSVIDNVSSGVPQDNVGGITMSGGTVKNTLLWGNGDENGAKTVNWLGAAANYSYCASDDVTDIEEGVPLAVAPYQYEDGLAMPLTGAPIIGKGLVDATWMTDATDLAGNPRLKGDKVSIGATEFVSNMTVTWEAVKYRTYERYSQIVEAGQVTGDTTGIKYLWDLDGDGVFEKTGSKQYLDLTKPGETVVTLKVTNTNGGEATCAHTFTIETYSTVMYVVKGNAGAEMPYATEATAAATIEDALAIAADGTKIIVLAETYQPAKTLTLANEVWLCGATGNRDDVIVDGNGAARCVVSIDNELAKVSALTVKRGSNYGGIVNNGGLVENCRITACTWVEYGGTSSVYLRGAVYNTGIIRDSLIDGNRGGGAYRNDQRAESSGVLQAGGILEGCVIKDNSVYDTSKFYYGGGSGAGVGIYQSGGIVRNCLIMGNTLGRYGVNYERHANSIMSPGACIAGGEFVNNTVISNTLTRCDDTKFPVTLAAVGVTGTGAVIRNTLIKDNFEMISGDELSTVAANGGTSSHCCLKDAETIAGSGNVEATDGCYVVKRNGQVVIRASSPCRDNGEDEDWMLYATDLYGKSRIFSVHVDIGASESQSGGLIILVK